VWAKLIFVSVDDCVKRLRIDQSLLDEERFERLHAQRRIRERRIVSRMYHALSFRLSIVTGCFRDVRPIDHYLEG
jgi:hypothetical protein